MAQQSVLTNAFVNGQWVTQEVSLRKILEANNDTHRATEPRRLAEIPTVGILSRTVIQSPTVNWIAPGRIRDELKNDIVFVGEDFVQIKEVVAGGHLRHVGTKSDFDSNIRAAKILGQPGQHCQKNYVKFEDPFSDDEDMLSLEDIPDIPIKTEDGVVSDPPAPTVPSQILILAMESSDLLFLFAHQSLQDQLRFHVCSLPLLKERSALEHPGRHLAIDPYSRAIAVGAHQSTIVIFRTKDMGRLRAQFYKKPTEWTPVIDERALRVPGVILKMDFLYPEKDDQDHVILLVVYRGLEKGSRIILQYFEWNHNASLSQLNEGSPMSMATSKNKPPDLIIPLKQRSSFLLIYEDEFQQFQNPLAGSAEALSFRGFGRDTSRERPQYPGLSSRKPLWTQWSRPHRTDTWSETNDAVYLAREDGVIMYLEIPHGGVAAKPSWAGQFKCHLDTAFAHYQEWSPENYPSIFSSSDFLITCGSMSTGQIIKIGAYPPRELSSPTNSEHVDRESMLTFQFLETMPNWGPTVDIALIDHSTSSGGRRERKRIFTTAGRQPFGSVAEIRNGQEALMTIQFDNPEFSSATGLWTFSVLDETALFVIISLPSETVIFKILAHSGEFDEINEENCELEFDARTILFSSLKQDPYGFIQVTDRGVSVLSTHQPDIWLKRACKVESFEEKYILKADLHSSRGIIAVAIRNATHSYLQIARIDTAAEEDKVLQWAESITDLANFPTSLLLFNLGVRLFLFVALSNASFRVLEVIEGGALRPVIEHQFESNSPSNDVAQCESALVLESCSEQPGGISKYRYMLICGMRDGSLFAAELLEANELHTGSSFTVPIGHTPVSVVPAYDQSESRHTAYFTCGSDMCRIQIDGGEASNLRIDSVWITDRMDTWLEQPSISFLRRPVTQPNDYSQISTAWTCLAGESLMLIHIGDNNRTVPRHLSVRGTPNRILYVEEMKIVVVGLIEIEADEKTRQIRGLLQFVRYEQNATDEEIPVENTFPLRSGERVNSMRYQVVRGSNGQRYTLVLVATGWNDGQGKTDGRLYIIRLKSNEDGTITAKSVKSIEHSKSACTALAVMCKPHSTSETGADEMRVVLGVGSCLYLYQISLEEKKTQKLAQYQMECPAMYITISDELVYVSTAQNSLYGMEIAEKDSTFSFRVLFNDGQARQSIHHLAVNLPGTTPDSITSTNPSSSSSLPAPKTLLLLSSKDSTITGLLQPEKPTHQLAARQLFEAALPRSITRFQRGRIHPPWRSSHLPGILASDILGTASDGSLYAFTVLDAHAWRLAKFLENLARWAREMELRRILRGQDVHIEIDPERGRPVEGARRGMHVCGDRLAVLVAKDGVEVLESWLGMEGWARVDGEVDPGIGVEERWMMLRRFGGEVVELEEGMERGEAVKRVVQWLCGLLGPVL